MSYNDNVICVENISKCYQIYNNPRDRLKQFFIPKFESLVGRESTQFYSEFWALQDINFEIKKGEAAGIIGRNGSGKSTLLQIITGTLTPTSGKVLTKGRIAALLELGSGFNPEFTGRENIYLNGAVLGLTKTEIDNKFDSIAGFADIGAHLDQPVKTYSSGMMVRLAFAVQVQLEPDILIVDEALAVGDALFQKRCFRQIEKLTSNGVTLLFVSHDQESVRTLTNKSILLDRGKQIMSGLSSEVLLEYRRLLHDEENKFYSNLTEEISERTNTETVLEITKSESISASNEDEQQETLRSDKLSFGEGEAVIDKVELFNIQNEKINVFNPGENIKIRVHFTVNQQIDKLNVGVRIRNKEGVKIYSWGTLNQDMFKLSNGEKDDLFWNKKFDKGQKHFVDLEFDCSLGSNLYEIQASVSYEETPDYFSQRILHWRDEAAFFHVHVLRDVYFFGGLTDLKMKAKW
ncbi:MULTISPECIES: ABC transporter ATP-binding protein [unclassified Enterobacter]|jgi:lipopolysaccharide transport system ATP-binding protein|uniref:ABC transporter ATP-binding protein n=1 Tax=unclassified Enterobacter TaxID=2608935 RepID=UPI0012AE57F5|nr:MULTISPECIES: ABC transporter ATP-binding protein [unclassified Enterobacter]MBB3304166.1 lipopolysaccharide transport system ATP-binding protein [Enterobacter sp. Sphag1F]MRT26892.1 ATP-binding cassette domain-containing protein [Enterobacteriaceae bacterium RIT697]NYI12729.1 lipopolysaccharide transport system ATP-binding protein [Enterobacter sp. Sphag71]